MEDHPDVREMVELFLQLDGFTVCSAADGVAALALLADNKPCLILLDVNMPRMDGITFGRELRRHSDPAIAGTPIILLTATANAQGAAEAVNAVEVMLKPVSFDKFVTTVERHCGPAR